MELKFIKETAKITSNTLSYYLKHGVNLLEEKENIEQEVYGEHKEFFNKWYKHFKN